MARSRRRKPSAALIGELGLGRLVSVHGFVAEAAELDAALQRSHLALNLRDPTMGEASASQLRIWQHGLPSLVTDIGWYATLPASTVAKVRRESELADIQMHLAEFLRAPERYREMGQAGRAYVQRTSHDRALSRRTLEIDRRRARLAARGK